MESNLAISKIGCTRLWALLFTLLLLDIIPSIRWRSGGAVLPSEHWKQKGSDFILNYGHFICGQRSTNYCGSAGCLTEVFASLPGGKFVKVLNDNVQGIKFETVHGRSAMLLYLHGSSCGKVGSAPCNETLYWNGEKFSPAK